MSVVINGTTGISGADGSAASPALRGADPDTGVFFPDDNTVAVATAGFELASFNPSGVSVNSPFFQVNGVDPIMTLVNDNYLGGGALFQMYGDGIAGISAFDSSFGSGEIRFQIAFAEVARITSAGNFQFNSGYGSVATAYGCRAWVNFNGFNGTIRGSGNVSSVTYNGTGVATVNFATAMPDANYNAVCSAHSAGFGRQSNAFPLYNGYSTGSVIIWYGNTINAAAENMDVVNVSVFR